MSMGTVVNEFLSTIIMNSRAVVLSANYNNSNYLSDYFESLLDNLEYIDSVVFVDDCSTDSSLDIAQSYKDRFDGKLNIVALSKNVGFSNALNEGLSKIDESIPFIARIDPDDVMSSKRIKKQVEFLSKNSEIGVVGSNVTYFDGQKDINDSHFKGEQSWIYNKYSVGLHGVIHGSVMFNTRNIDRSELWYNQSLVPAEDYDLFSRLIVKGVKFSNLNEPLTKVRIHTNSVSNFLPYTTIEKTFSVRDRIFGTKTPMLSVLIYHRHLYFYRKYLYSTGFVRYIYLLSSAILNPKKVISRLLNL